MIVYSASGFQFRLRANTLTADQDYEILRHNQGALWSCCKARNFHLGSLPKVWLALKATLQAHVGHHVGAIESSMALT